MQGEPANTNASPVSGGQGGGGLLDALSGLGGAVVDWLPFAFWVIVVVGGLVLADRVLIHRATQNRDKKVPRLLGMIVLSIAGLVLLIIALPVDDRILTDQTKSNLITLVGLSITAVVTLSSTTLAANGMAGLMLRGVGSFRPGDFVRVGEQFGRVTERGLFHVEIQTEDRDLVTLPNLYLATNPVRVVRSSGTVVSAVVGLGYDTPHGRVTDLLKRAAEHAGLVDPFVWIMELQDHAVSYRVAGMLEEVKTLVSARSTLHAAVLDTLHGAGVEIVSPGFVYQRRTDVDQQVIPRAERPRRVDRDAPESKVFDKAESAERLEIMRTELDTLRKAIKEMEKDTSDESAIERRRLESRANEIEAQLETELDDGAVSDADATAGGGKATETN
ncbi:MAG: mechanosensitive ion channel domain-containing protein [Planctomycetota bacterium]